MSAVRSWLQAVSRAGSSTVPVVVVGSSSVAGSNANSLNRRYVSMLAAILRGRHNTPTVPGGIGVAAADTGTGHGWTRSGGSTVTNRGLGFSAYQLAAGNFIERAWTGTAVTVLYEQGPGAGAFQVSIDGGAATTVTPNTGATTVNAGTWTSPTVAAGSHTVRITGVGTCVIEAVYGHHTDTASGVQVWPSGLGGATTAELASTPGLVTRLGQLQPALVVLALTANDYSTGVDPATSKARVQTWLSQLFAVRPSTTVLLLHQHQRLDVTTPAFPWSAYGTAMQEIAAADPDRVAFLDVSGKFPTSQAADTWDLIDTDNVHMTDRGHQVLADEVAYLLGLDLTYDADLSRVRVSAAVGPSDTSVLVRRSADQVRWTAVRGGSQATVTGGVAFLDDYEFAPGVPNWYWVTAGERIGDSFSGRTVASGWGNAAETGEPWTSEGGSASDHSVGGGTGKHSAGAVGSSRRAIIGPAVYGVDVAATVSTPVLAAGAPQHATTMIRYVDVDNFLMLQARLNVGGSPTARIIQRLGGVETELIGLTVSGLTHVANTGIRLRGQMVGNLLRVKAWLASGAEPPIWHATAVFSAVLAAGRAGVRSFLESGNTNTLPVVFTWDDFESRQVEYTGQVTPALDGVWLKNLAKPFLNRQVTVLDYSDVERQSRTGVFQVIGRSVPVAVSDLRGSRQWSLEVLTQTAEDAEDVDLLLAAGDPLLVHVPADCDVPGGYVSVGDTNARRTARRSARRVFTLPCTEVAAPGPDVVGATVTCQTVLNTYPTCQAVLDAHDTCLSLMELIGDPTDVIVP